LLCLGYAPRSEQASLRFSSTETSERQTAIPARECQRGRRGGVAGTSSTGGAAFDGALRARRHPVDMSPKLLTEVRLAIRRKHYSRRTEEAYVQWVRRFVRYHGLRHPAAMGPREINAFLTHLATERSVSASTQNQAASALLFLYREVLGRKVAGLDEVVRAKRPRNRPVVLTRRDGRGSAGSPRR